MKTTLTADDAAGWYLCYSPEYGREAVGYWNGSSLSNILGTACQLRDFTNFRRQYAEEEVASLREELARLKSAPYVMRKADKPDCVGLWANREGSVLEIYNEKTSPTHGPPFYYLGPIPVVVEQQPPKVVKVRCKKTGQELRAIPRVVPGDALSYCLLNDDGTTKCFVTTNSVEEVQS